MTDAHEKVTQDRQQAAEEVLEALKDLKRAAGMPEDEESDL